MAPTLFSHDDVVISTTRVLLRNRFTLSAPDGTPLGVATQRRFSLAEMFTSSRSIDVEETATDGTPLRAVLTITDPFNLLRDSFEVFLPGGAVPLARVTNRFSLARERFTITMDGLPDIEARGSVWRWNFELASRGATIATIDTRWSGLGRFMMGKRTYVLHMTPGLSEHQRAAIVGTTLCLEMARAKRNARASS
ncbi:scramblase [Corynebacterium sp.]|uniref:LURP-one-related/scramblase family protein n=1 Tax=Corynebacterium sp. TaxID=1720 RepID=UPI002A916D07|nr:scramblase [Corynebacterium sp.]MDY5784859.1 scramblase [Corynebacterium sp.]